MDESVDEKLVNFIIRVDSVGSLNAIQDYILRVRVLLMHLLSSQLIRGDVYRFLQVKSVHASCPVSWDR